jgi:hypothetical protein
MRLAQRPERIAKVLESCATNDEIERVCRKCQRRGIAMAEIDLYPGAHRGFGGDADKRATNVDPLIR